AILQYKCGCDLAAGGPARSTKPPRQTRQRIPRHRTGDHCELFYF
ncbi:MAG: hypothetical protein JWR69_463, partial [Pedosphaera sp.]|nr:hypothetical protein [Pedosphaera sp.]